jgi:hypothetical protein
MRHGLIAAVLVLVLAGLLGNVACSPGLAPVYSPVTAAGLSPNGAPYTQQQVEAAVVQGSLAKGWTVVHHEPGTIVADVSSGGHGARVRILVNGGGWRIVHEQSSPGLKFRHDDRHGEIIHRRYNHWVRLLDESIRHALVTQTAGGAYPAPSAAPAVAPAPAPAG